MKHFWLFVSGICVLAGCSPATPLSLTNHSGVALENVVVAGAGFEQAVGTIAAGATTTTHVRPSGESGLKLSFRSGTQTVVLAPQGYFEGGGIYTVRAVVEPDLSATVNVSLR